MAHTAPSRVKLSPFRILWPYVVRYKGRAGLAFLALLLAAATTLSVPFIVRLVVDDVFASGNLDRANEVFSAGILLVVVLAFASASRFYLVTTLGERIVADVRADVFAHLMRLDMRFFDTVRAGEITSRLTADTTQIKAAVGASASIALRNLFMFCGAVVMMIISSPRLSALVLLAIPLIILPVVFAARKVRRRSARAQDLLAEASALASEFVGAVRTVKAYVFEAEANERFGALVNEAFEGARQAISARAILTLCIIFLVFASILTVLWYGSFLVITGRMSAGELTQFLLFSVFAAGAMAELSQVLGEVNQAAGATERLGALLQEPYKIFAPANAITLPRPIKGEVAFEKVSFAYEGAPDSPVLQDVSFSIAPGERVAIVGPSGAGKTTIFQLVMRFHDTVSGAVRIDGVDLKNTAPRALRGQIAYVSQEPDIFAASVFDNIRFGTAEASLAQVQRAAKEAAAHDFIMAMDKGYDTPIGERGVTLSGGQKQRIAIARAILKNAPLLLLDEATSALDADSEARVQEALEDLLENRTALIIAHRLATVRAVDRILVFDEGRLVEEGTHDALVAQGGLYAKLAKLQFTDG